MLQTYPFSDILVSSISPESSVLQMLTYHST